MLASAYKRKKSLLLAAVYAVLLSACALILVCASAFSAGGTVAAAKGLLGEWQAFETARGSAFAVTAADATVSMAEVYNTAYTSNGSASGFQSEAFKNAMLLDPAGAVDDKANHRYRITLSTAEELVKFSLGSYGTNTDGKQYDGDYARFIRSARYVLVRNVDFADGSVYRTTDGGADIPVRPLASYAFSEAVSFVSNAGYYGYNNGFASTVPGKFNPVVSFSGEFDGNGHTVSGLFVSSSAERVSGSYLTVSAYDAMFSEILPGGSVRDLGLVDYRLEIPTGATAEMKRDTAVLAGRNEGTVSRVFSLGATVTDGGAAVAAPLVLTDTGTMTEYYSAERNGVPGYVAGEGTERFTAANWRQLGTATGRTLTVRKITARYDGYYVLSGVTVTGANTYTVSTEADFVALTEAVLEHRMGNASVTIAQDLDFRYMPGNALIPAASLAGSWGTFRLQGAGTGAAQALTAVANLNMESYLQSGLYRNAGLFNWFSGGGLTVSDLVFYRCRTVMPTEYADATVGETNAGLLGGQLGGTLTVNNVFVDSTVLAQSGAVPGGLNIGGLYGRTNAGAVDLTRVYVETATSGGVLTPDNLNKNYNAGGILGWTGVSGTLDTVYITGRVVAPIVTRGADLITVGGYIGTGAWAKAQGVSIAADILTGDPDAPASTVGGSVTNRVNAGGFAGRIDSVMTLTTADALEVSGTVRLNFTNVAAGISAGGLTGNTGVALTGSAGAYFKVSDVFTGSFAFPSPSLQGTVGEGAADGSVTATASGFDLAIGNITGYQYLGRTATYTYVDQDKALTVPVGTVSGNVTVGGISGHGASAGNPTRFSSSRTSGRVSIESSGSNADKTLTATGFSYYAAATGCTAGGAVRASAADLGQVFALGLGYAGTFTDCVLTGSVEALTQKDSNGNAAGISYGGTLTGCSAPAGAAVSYTAQSMTSATIRAGGITVAGKVSSSVFSGTVDVRLAAGTATVYAGGIAAFNPGTIENSVHTGSVSVAMSDGTAFIGGILGNNSGNHTLDNNVNSGTLSLTASAGTTYIGGILGGTSSGTATVRGCVNQSALTIDSGAVVSMGGIVGRHVGGKLVLTGCHNIGELRLTVSSPIHYTGVGGILGMFSYGNVSLSGSANHSPVSSTGTGGWTNAGGIVGVVQTPHGSAFSISDSVNAGAVSAANAGGLIGMEWHSGGTVSQVAVSSVVNYGSVTGDRAGGIGGLWGNDVKLSGAVNYGTVTGISSQSRIGGIIGQGAAANGNNEEKTYYTDLLNYGVLTGTYRFAGGIVGALAYKSSPGSLNNSFTSTPQFVSFARNVVIAADDTDTTRGAALVGSATAFAPENTGVFALTSSADATYDLYADPTFFLHPDKEADTYAAQGLTADGATEAPTLVWSELPYGKGTAAAHSPLTSEHCFAVTTPEGRMTGRYVGSDLSIPQSIVIGGATLFDNAALAASAVSCAQITGTRDTFLIDPGEKGFALRDTGKTGAAKQALPAVDFGENKYVRNTTQNGATVRTQTFYSIIENTSSYYINNITDAGITVDGSRIVVDIDSTMLSAGVKFAFSFETADVVTVTLPATENPVRIGRYRLDIWQGDAMPPEGSRYRNTYFFEVWYYNSDPTVSADGTTAFSLETNTETTALDTVADLETGDAVSYDFETPAGVAVEAGWEKAVLSARFSTVNISEAAASDIRLSLWQKNADGSYTAYDPSPARFELSYTYAATGTGGTVHIGNLSFTEVTALVTVTAVLFDSARFNALPAGEYRLTLEVPKAYSSGGIDYFERHFRFTAAQSDDVRLRYAASGAPVDGSAAVTVQWIQPNGDASFAARTTSPRLDLSAGTADPDGVTVDYGHTFSKGNNDLPPYGSIFDPGSLTANGPIGIFPGLILPEGATASVPHISFTVRDDGQYTAVYSFTVTSSAGSRYGRYTFTLDWSFSGTQAPHISTTSPVDVEVGKKETKSVSGMYPVNDNTTFLTLEQVLTYYQNTDGVFEAVTPPDTLTVTKTLVAGGGYYNGYTAQFVPETPNGVYRFVPQFRFRFKFDLARFSDTASYTLEIPAGDEIRLTPFVTSFSSACVTVTKTASKLSYLRDVTYAVSGTDHKSTAVSYVSAADPLPMADASRIDAATAYPSLAGIGESGARLNYNYTSGGAIDRFPAMDSNRIKRFIVYPLFDSAANDLDYNTYVYMIVNGEIRNEGVGNADLYNDQYVSLYTLDGNTPKDRLTPYRTVYTDATETTVDYQIYRLFLPESTMTGVRVYAEDQRYYTDYSFYSTGPARNQTFQISIDAPEMDGIEGTLFNLAVKTRVADGSGFRYTRTTYLPFMPVAAGDAFYAAPPVLVGAERLYRNEYTVTRNMASTYELVLETDDPRFTLTVESVEVEGSISLVWTPGSRVFTISGENPATTRIAVRIEYRADYVPPWGYETEARPT